MKKSDLQKGANISKNIPNLNLFYEIKEESYINEDLDNTFIIFYSIDNILYLIYSTNKKSIISYDLNNFQKINEINGHHKKCITNFKHYSDTKRKRDLIMSISRRDNTIRIWDIKNWDCLHKLSIKYFGNIFTASFINDQNQIYIITNINIDNNPNSIAVIDFNGTIIKTVNGSTEIVCFIDTYYDKKFAKIYILFGHLGFVESYDYQKNKIYHRYIDNNGDKYKIHCSIIVNECKSLIELIESCIDGYIRIWDFHSRLLIKKINVGDKWLYGLCLWNNDLLYAGYEDKTIKVINIENGEIIKILTGHKNSVITVKKIYIPKYGYCLISQEKGNSQIKLWKKVD